MTEGEAVRFLKKKGFRILATNWRPSHGHGELDIIAREGFALVFVEVRARKEGALIRGALSLDAHKRKTLRQTINVYLGSLRRRNPTQKPPSWRFDVVEVEILAGKRDKMSHFEGVEL